MKNIIKTFKLYTEAAGTEELTDEQAILTDFVNFLPKDLTSKIDKILNNVDKSTKLGKDAVFYMLMGQNIERFGKNKDLLEDLINSDEHEDFFFDLMDDKYGRNLLEW